MPSKSSLAKSNASLNNPEQFSTQLLDSLPSAVYTCDTDGYLKLYNKAASKLWGIEPKIGVTKWCGSWKIYKPDGSLSASDECPMALTIKGGLVRSGEEIIIERPDGVRIHVFSHPMFIRDDAKNVVGAINILEDITRLRNAEQQLREISILHTEGLKRFKSELAQVNEELAFRDGEKGKREAELVIANGELVFQNEEKSKRAAELIIANGELVFQNEEKGKRAAELIIANSELSFQNGEKAKRAAELINANEELVFQNQEKKKRADELVVAYGELAFQNEEKEKRAAELMAANRDLAFQIKRAAELLIANGELSFQNREKEKRASELLVANGELAFQNGEKGKRAAELIIANDELAFQNEEKAKRAAELSIANGELAFQNGEKEKRAAELIIANGELAFQNREKEKRASELIIANRELVFQNEEKGKRAAELIIANEELLFQNIEKEKRAAELVIANRELLFQNSEKEKRAAELIIANGELAFQNIEKGKRASELTLANGELAFQIGEKEKRSAELVIANLKLAFQNEEKGKRESELVIANKELAFQNGEKEKRAAELVIANVELAFQNIEKEKRAAELIIVNSELEAFSYVSSHDLQEPLRKIQTLSNRLLEIDNENLSDKGKEYLNRMHAASIRMRLLIDNLLAFSHLNVADRKFEETDLNKILDEVKNELKEIMEEQQVTIEAMNLSIVKIIPFQFKQIMYNLINNALKFSRPGVPPRIVIKSTIAKGIEFAESKLVPDETYCHISISDNGIGFEQEYSDRIFGVFQRLHVNHMYAGSGIGLAIVKKVIDNHNGTINAIGTPNEGATFNMYLPVS
ncbi:MAG TPA: ATP-binding protein [Cyclobacteriaceae bacterium]|nr:ATP-binding protein [Cyclobacteriaceae bacterium]